MESGKHYQLTSGAKLFVSVSEYEKVMALHDALVAELRGQGAGALDIAKIQKAIDYTAAKRLAEAAGQKFDENNAEADDGMNALLDKVLAVIGSPRVKACLFACAEKAVYYPNGSEESAVPFKLGTPGYGVFDNPSCLSRAREDFYDICRAIAEENLRPFGKALFSMFMGHVGKRADSRESTSTPA